MFNKKLKEQIADLQRAVADLQNPFKYDIGDKVEADTSNYCCNPPILKKTVGHVVTAKGEMSYYAGRTYRSNYYSIFDGKTIFYVHEAEIIKKIK